MISWHIGNKWTYYRRGLTIFGLKSICQSICTFLHTFRRRAKYPGQSMNKVLKKELCRNNQDKTRQQTESMVTCFGSSWGKGAIKLDVKPIMLYNITYIFLLGRVALGLPYARVKGHLEPTHLKSSPLFTFFTKSLGQDSPSVHIFSITIGSRFPTAFHQADFFSRSRFTFKQNNKTIKRPFVRSKFTVLQILIGKDSSCSKIN